MIAIVAISWNFNEMPFYNFDTVMLKGTYIGSVPI